jgi:hypothetical protein
MHGYGGSEMQPSIWAVMTAICLVLCVVIIACPKGVIPYLGSLAVCACLVPVLGKANSIGWVGACYVLAGITIAVVGTQMVRDAACVRRWRWFAARRGIALVMAIVAAISALLACWERFRWF